MSEQSEELTREEKLLRALKGIATLWPYPPNAATICPKYVGLNAGKGRAILLDAALNIARKAVAEYNGETYVHPESED